MKTWLLFALKLLLTAGCLAWAFSGVDIDSTILSHPGDLDFRWIALGLALAGISVVLNALRWRIFLQAQGIHTPFARVLELTMIGNLFGVASVGGLGGDAARILLLIRQQPRRKMAITISVLMDHVSGMVAMSLMFFVLTAGRFEALEERSALGTGVLHFTWVYLGGGLLVMLVGFIVMSPMVHGRVHRDGRWVRWEFIKTFPEAWDVYRRKWPQVLCGIGVSCLMLCFIYLAFWAGARAAGCEVGPGEIFSVMPVVDAISAIPVSVSGIGVREKLFEVLLGDLAGIPGGLAVSASLTGFMLHVFWALVGGFLFLRHRGEVTVREIRESHV